MRSVPSPRPEAVAEYNQRFDEALDKTVWMHPGGGADVGGYYRNSQGRSVVACPWRLVDYWTMLREPDPQALEFLSRTPQPTSVGV